MRPTAPSVSPAIASGRPGALEEDEPLEQVRVHARPLGGLLDRLAVAGDAHGGGGGAVRRARVEDVAVAGRGAADELVLAVGVVGERIGEGRRLFGARHERLARRGPVAAQGRARGQGQDDEEAREQHDAGAAVSGTPAHRPSPWQTSFSAP